MNHVSAKKSVVKTMNMIANKAHQFQEFKILATGLQNSSVPMYN